MEQQRGRPRIADVAREAGVSKTAVSFAFNSPERLSPDTATRIREVADSLGYRPHPVARMLTQRRTRTLGVLTPQALSVVFANPFFATFSEGVAVGRRGGRLRAPLRLAGLRLAGPRGRAGDGGRLRRDRPLGGAPGGRADPQGGPAHRARRLGCVPRARRRRCRRRGRRTAGGRAPALPRPPRDPRHRRRAAHPGRPPRLRGHRRTPACRLPRGARGGRGRAPGRSHRRRAREHRRRCGLSHEGLGGRPPSHRRPRDERRDGHRGDRRSRPARSGRAQPTSASSGSTTSSSPATSSPRSRPCTSRSAARARRHAASSSRRSSGGRWPGRTTAAWRPGSSSGARAARRPSGAGRWRRGIERPEKRVLAQAVTRAGRP